MFRAIFISLVILPAAFSQSDTCPAIRQVTTTIQTTPFTSLPGQAVNIGIYVQPVLGTPDPQGTVQLSDGTTDLGTFPLNFGQASFTRTFNEAGAHQLAVYYSGDANYCDASAVKGHQVDHLTPTITLTASATTLTATIGPAPPQGVAAPNGPVQFLEGTTVLGSAVPKDGVATLPIPALSPGAHTMVAVLTGDAVYYSVRSTPVTVTVNRSATRTILAASAGVQQTALTATVTADSGTPTGTVTFVDSVRNLTLGTVVLTSGRPATVSISAAQVLASAGHDIVANYSGADAFAPSASAPISIPVALNAAGVTGNTTSEEIVSLFGLRLANITQTAGTIPLPETFAGYRVTVTDATGRTVNAALYFLSPTQINFVTPAGLATGAAQISVVVPTGAPAVIPIAVNIAPVAPGIFTVSGDGTGLPAANVVKGQSTAVLTSAGITLGADPVYLILYGTGIRNRTSLSGVTCTLAGTPATVAYAGPQSESPGLDQINVLIPASLAGKGDVTLSLTVDGQPANPVTFKIQ